MIVTDHIGVHDLMALMQFSLLPEDDLNLASLLKSPLLGMSEDDLFDLSYGRTTSLWQVLRTSERYAHYASYLMRVMQWMKSNRPYEFFNKVFTSPCPSSDRSGMCAFKNRLGDDVHDIFYEFLSLAMRYEETYVPDFQGFIEWLKQNPAEIKRELESDGNEVRIMTVHGSKGLQAPIVILPETIRNGWSNSSKGSDRFLWPRQTDLSLPIWCPRSGDEDALYAQQSQAIKIRDIHEDKRLLYVAMTRAEERLYVCGYLKKKKPVDESWYVYIKNALENCDQTENDDDILRLRHVTTADPDRVKEKQDKYDEGDISVPDWLYAPIKKEQSLQYPFNPSQLVDEMGETIEDAFYTNVRPIYLSRDKAILRGNIIHKLLELLPAASLDKRQTMADNYCSRYTGDLEKDVLLDLQREVFDLLNHPDYGLFFHDNALAEVPVIAKFEDGTSLSGVIDRLYVDEKTVWILDYKTSQTIPDDDCAVPEAYILQLQAYERAIKKIYPDHDIKKALLWSRAPKLMIL